MLVNVHTLNTGDEIAQRSHEWLSLAAKLSQEPPFCRPETWIPAMQSLLDQVATEISPAQQAVIFELQDDGGLAGILPLYRKGRKLLTLSENQIDYQDMLASNSHDACQLLKTAIDYAVKEKLVFITGHVPEFNFLSDAIRKSLPLKGAWLCKRYFGVCVVADFDLETPDGDGFLRVIPRRQRRKFNSSNNRIKAEDGNFEVLHLWAPDVTEADLEAIGQLHRENQQLRSGESPFADTFFTRYLWLQTQTQKSFLLSLLKKDDELIAFCMGYATENAFYYYITDYYRKHAHLAPGGFLLIATCKFVIDQFNPTHFRLDMLLGSETYKTQWETDHYYVDRIVIIPKALSLLPMAAAYHFAYSLKALKNRILRIGYFAESR